jgi:glycosyltransferase involved in cell wall biosynthesis
MRTDEPTPRNGNGGPGTIPVLMLARVLDGGGIERDVSKFSRHLREHGIEPHVACFNAGGMRWREIADAGIPLVTIPVTSFKSKSAVTGASALRQYIAEKGIRLLHAFDVPADMFAVPLARLWRIPVLSSQLSFRELMPMHTRLIMAVIDRIATGVFVNCEALADHLSSDWKLAHNRIHVCYNGYEPQEFNPRGRKRPRELADASIVVGTVALLRPEKNLEMLVESFARLYRIDNRARLLIVGSGPEKSELVRKAAELGLTDACVFRDTVSKPAEWMRAIDVFVLPSFSEGFSNSLLEAMACGCCPVASRVGGTPELVDHGERGVLFESGNLKELSDALVYLMQHPEEQRRLAENAASFVRQRLTIQQASARLADIYRNLLADQKNKINGKYSLDAGIHQKSRMNQEQEGTHKLGP